MTQFPDNESELKAVVRAATGYDDIEDELQATDLDSIVGQSEGRLMLEADVTEAALYNNDGLSFALAAYTKIRAKAAAENVGLSSYSLGAEEVSFDTSDPDTSQQLQLWHEDARVGLERSDADDQTDDLTIANSSQYIGDTYVYGHPHDHNSRRL